MFLVVFSDSAGGPDRILRRGTSARSDRAEDQSRPRRDKSWNGPRRCSPATPKCGSLWPRPTSAPSSRIWRTKPPREPKRCRRRSGGSARVSDVFFRNRRLTRSRRSGASVSLLANLADPKAAGRAAPAVAASWRARAGHRLGQRRLEQSDTAEMHHLLGIAEEAANQPDTALSELRARGRTRALR